MPAKPTYEELEQKVKELEQLEVECKRAEMDLQDAEQKWMSLVENTNDFIMIIDDNSRIQYINKAIPPNTVDQVTGKTLYDFSAPEHHEMIRQAVTKVFETGKQGSYTSSVKHPTGIQWFETTMVPIIEENKVENVMSFNKIITENKQAEEALRKAHDELEIQIEKRTVELVSTNEKLEKEINERKKSEDALQESEEKYRSLFEGATNPITIIDKEGIIIMINDAGARQLGLPQHACVGKSVFEVIPDLDDSYRGMYRQVIDTGKEVTREDFVELPSGFRWFWSILQPVSDINGKRYGVQAISYDITERKKAEEALKTSLREKEILLREIHHRVKNNFEIVSSLVDMGSMQIENKEIQNLCKDTQARIHSMALIHDQLYQSDRFDQIDMARHAQNMLDHLSHIHAGNEKGIISVIEPSKVYLSLNQAIPCALVLNELITNAFKHAFQEQEKGTVYISINNLAGNIIQISVKDDGRSMPDDAVLSNPTGLGLTLAKQLIVGQLKGEMRVNIDNGTEFQIEFKKVE